MSLPAKTEALSFESIKHLDENGVEYWFARDLYPLLGYRAWQNFQLVIQKARQACLTSNINVDDHFMEKHKMIDVGKGAKRKIEDFALSRYACYLIVQNGDASKPVIAAGQTYFAIQTRRQELADEQNGFNELSDDEKRLFLRQELRIHNKQLADAAHNAGIMDPKQYAIFQNFGYKGLYGGLDAKAIHKRKGLKKNEQILDHMGHTELAANLFRATQTEEKLRRENIKGVYKANQTHYKVGKAVRETIQSLGGTMPEDLPTPEKIILQLEKEKEKQIPAEKKAPDKLKK